MPWSQKLIDALDDDDLTEGPKDGRILKYNEAINEALCLAMDLDPNVIVCGQGVDDPAGMFGTTTGLAEKFGSERVFDVPVAEESMMGICTGAAMRGLRPINFHNRPDFILLAMNQLVSHAAKVHYFDNGQNKVPLVIWSAIGRGWGCGPQHSQAIQGMLMGVPGLKIVMPSTPADAKGLLLAAIADPNPTLVFEHRWVMRTKGVVPEGIYKVPLGKATYRRRGTDLTIVGNSHMLQLAILAADDLKKKEGITADIIDLRSIKPLDIDTIVDSVKKTGRLLIADTAWEIAGVSAEIGFQVAQKLLHQLKAPIQRVGFPDLPTPAGDKLEQFYYPDEERISVKIKELCK